MIRRGLVAKRRNISVEIIATINAKNKPCEPNPAYDNTPLSSGARAPKEKKLANATAAAPNESC